MSAADPRDSIFNLETAADLCHVSRDTVADWITTRGMRAFPVGNAVERRNRDYLIVGKWLFDFLESNSTAGVRTPKSAEDKPTGQTATRKADRRNPLGKCPVP